MSILKRAEEAYDAAYRQWQSTARATDALRRDNAKVHLEIVKAAYSEGVVAATPVSEALQASIEDVRCPSGHMVDVNYDDAGKPDGFWCYSCNVAVKNVVVTPDKGEGASACAPDPESGHRTSPNVLYVGDVLMMPVGTNPKGETVRSPARVKSVADGSIVLDWGDHCTFWTYDELKGKSL